MLHMATNLDLDPELVEHARALGCHKTKKAAVTAALEEYVRKRRLEKFLSMLGTVEFDEDWDPLEERRLQRELAAVKADRLWGE
jgi:Arc/MetJ family transcription regulator